MGDAAPIIRRNCVSAMTNLLRRSQFLYEMDSAE